MSQREAGELALKPRLADMTEVSAVAGGGSAHPKDRTPESHGERDRAEQGFLTLNLRRPDSGPLHARPPAS